MYQHGADRGKWRRYPVVTLVKCLLMCSVSARRWYETSCCPNYTYRTMEWRSTDDTVQIRRFPTLCSLCGIHCRRRILQCCVAVSCAGYRDVRGRAKILFALWHANYCGLFAKLSLHVRSDCIGQDSSRGDRWWNFIFHFLWLFFFQRINTPPASLSCKFH